MIDKEAKPKANEYQFSIDYNYSSLLTHFYRQFAKKYNNYCNCR